MVDSIYGRYKKIAQSDIFTPQEIKSGDFDSELRTEEMTYCSDVDKAFSEVDSDLQSILNDLKGVKGIDLIDEIKQRLEWLSVKIQ